jgi:tetratricopeptide (TPR) repeat protein
MDKHIQRASILMSQGRYELAEKELRQGLAADPDSPLLHALLAGCLNDRERYQEATAEAEAAIALAPDMAYGHYVRAMALFNRNRHDEAEKAALEAVRLQPEDPDYHGMVGQIRFARREWQPALEAAEKGLEQDPEHVVCNNLRAMALVKLGRNAEAGATMAATLARDPENAFSHANLGWTLLHEGDRQKALEHFREALRLDPELDFAKAGIVEALKSKNIVYALMLRYFLWMGRLSRRAQWAIVLGLLFGNRALHSLADRNPALEPWVQPVFILYIAFAVMTWIASPLFNLLLRLNRFGRYALSRDQIVASNWIGALAVPALVGLVVWLCTDSVLAWVVMATFGLLLLPVSAVFNCERGWPRWMMICYTIGLAVVGVAWAPLAMARVGGVAALAFQAFIVGSFLSGFVANALMMATPRR